MIDAARIYTASKSLRNWAFTRAVRRSFAACGTGVSITPPTGIDHARFVHLGNNVILGPHCRLSVLGEPRVGDIRIRIADRVTIMGFCTLASASSIEIGAGALFARGVYIADHTHAFGDVTRFVRDQGVTSVAPVSIGSGAWLGENVIVLPGVTIGRGAVVGAHSVVRNDVPDHSLAVGAPARVVRSWGAGSDKAGGTAQ